ncbi:enoyl-CoA hydratase/isomerase family protein [Microbacterium karelineae]|uniref:enoyl-CoA hydratase/isomerase family protein n=1 Tax=Microbacterium karelineae TaxID=2654283 RepID=UPI0018D4C714|nr:enoyl-CoA hydratase-related protein [Microbacterium karelineae]
MNISDRIDYDVVDGVARIELAHAPVNSLDQLMAEALCDAADRATRDAASGGVRVVVVSARGKLFSVGGDLSEFAGSPDRGGQVTATAGRLHAGLTTLRALDVPVVSVIDGTAAAAGLGVALVGDIVIAAAEARLVVAYTAAGLTPDCGLSWVIPHVLPAARAMDFALTNRVLTGMEAAQWGLVSRAVAGEDLPSEVDAVVGNLRGGAADAIVETKRLLLDSSRRTMNEQMEAEAATIAHAIVHPDGIEGVDAFLAKRQPIFH